MKNILYLAKKYVKLDSHTILPILAITIGIGFLIVVVSIISGFDHELIKNLTSVGPDILLKGNFSKGSLKELKSYNAFLYDRKEGVIYNPENSLYSGVQVNYFSKKYVEKLYGSSFNFLIGDALSQKIKASNLSFLYLYIPNGSDLKDISPNIYQVGKIFKTGIYQYDLINVIVEKKLDYAPYIFIKLKDPMNALKEKEKIKKIFPFSQVYTWMDMNENIIQSLKIESMVVFLVILFTLLLSGFGISNSLIQRVYERRKDMGILFSFGFSKKDFMALIILESIIMWVIGALFGISLGFLLNFIVSHLNISLPSNIYYVTKVPILFDLKMTIFILIFSFLISLFSSIFPAIKASKLDPIELIRFE
jgi:lipoprotein-releasing system permease protein